LLYTSLELEERVSRSGQKAGRSTVFRNHDGIVRASRNAEAIQITPAMINDSFAINDLQCRVGAGLETLT
jgi:hypothetical protein